MITPIKIKVSNTISTHAQPGAAAMFWAGDVDRGSVCYPFLYDRHGGIDGLLGKRSIFLPSSRRSLFDHLSSVMFLVVPCRWSVATTTTTRFVQLETTTVFSHSSLRHSRNSSRHCKQQNNLRKDKKTIQCANHLQTDTRQHI